MRAGQPPERGRSRTPSSGVFRGTVTRSAMSMFDTVDVSIDRMGGGLPFEGCPFTPIDATIPTAGDRAWLMIDDNGAGVVVAWRPTSMEGL